MYNRDQFLFEQTSICEANYIQQLTMKKKQQKLILPFFGGKSKPNGRWPSVHLAQMVSLSLMVLKRRRTIGRETLWAFLQIFPLREGKEVASQLLSQTAFFKAAHESSIGLREAMQVGLAFLGTNLIRCCKKAKVSFSMWGYGQMGLEADGVWGRQGQGEMGLGANGSGQRPHGKQHPGLPAITDQVHSPRSQLSCIASLKPIKDFWAALKKVSKTKAGRQLPFPLSSKNPPKSSKFLFQQSCASSTISSRG